MDSVVMYEDDNDCGDQCHSQNAGDIDYEYIVEQETIYDLYNYCLSSTLIDTFEYLVPLIICALICNVAGRISKIPHKVFHCIIATTGIYTIWHYVNECFYLLLIFICLYYLFLCLPKKHRQGTKIFLPCLLLILYCEIFMKPKDWHKVRGVMMIAIMKASSIANDMTELEGPVNLCEYIGYMLCSVNLLFGPWTSFESYVNLYKKTSWNLWWIIISICYLIGAFFCLCISNCWMNWILSNSAGKWMVAFRDALAFRTSHYFICFTASSIMLAGGYPLSQTVITNPLKIEMPRSLVQVVTNWNIPMHIWLKTYVFRPCRKQFGYFYGIVMTYAASSLLHGLNFQLAAVLLSLAFYTYTEYNLRALLANVFNACIGSKPCSLHKCEHLNTPVNCYWVTLVNAVFGALAIFHLAYLGLMFDTSEAQETGYSYSHTINKWSQLGFASHWVAFATYCAYYLIR
ncbi:protein-serine O-palmitoleoyltransferase porcupine [Copidosoma floridanum]|uniref:protein-serine O-palmitoleoyltransferase porcupine n=1 Tax=Copidosoma floridanum TaxID=29053 RepID=UPI0006C9A35B|nr:protein-serine O-palmitoleoyltransferase porcupine [Copidosoma floridanum]